MTGIIKRAAQTMMKAISDRAVASVKPLDSITIGTPVSRVDGYLKVTGAATYASDTLLPHMAHAVLVPSTIARGRITSIDQSEAAALPGVIAILTHENAPRLRKNLVPQIGDRALVAWARPPPSAG